MEQEHAPSVLEPVRMPWNKGMETPERKSLSEAAESVGCAGVKIRH